MTEADQAETIVLGEETVSTVSPEMRGLHAGAIVLVGMVAANLGNYVFHLLTARALGPSPYSDVATLAALTSTVGLPLGGVQVFVARHVAAETARGQRLNEDGYLAGFSSAMFVAGIGLTAAFLLAAPIVQHALSIGSLWAVIFTALFALPSFLAPALIGAAQGRQQFVLVAVALGAPPIVRIVMVGAALAAGLGVSGAMAATFVAAISGVLIPFVALRHSFGPVLAWRPRISRHELTSLAPVVAGLLAITALSTDDLVVAKAAFSSHEAGLYGSASLIGRVILYLPTAIATVLLPKVSARVASRRATTDILLQSTVVTGLFCVLSTIVYAAAPHLIVKVAFGSKYEGTASLLWMFGVAMTFYALANVLLTYQLGHGRSRTSWFLLGSAVVQAALFGLFHSSPRELLTVSIVVGGFALLLLELVVAPTLLQATRRAHRR